MIINLQKSSVTDVAFRLTRVTWWIHSEKCCHKRSLGRLSLHNLLILSILDLLARLNPRSCSCRLQVEQPYYSSNFLDTARRDV